MELLKRIPTVIDCDDGGPGRLEDLARQRQRILIIVHDQICTRQHHAERPDTRRGLRRQRELREPPVVATPGEPTLRVYG